MFNINKRILLIFVSLLIILASVTFANASYPERAITCLIAYPPGGGSDVLAQAVHPYLEKYLGVPIINVYKGGASGAVGWTHFANTAKPDGYNIAIINLPPIVGNIIMYPNEIEYSMDDFQPLYNVVLDPGLIFTAANSKFETAVELFDYVKEHPNQVTIAHSGIGSDDWVMIRMIEIASGLQFIKVPFPGSGPAWQATMGGHVDVGLDNLSIVFQQIQGGTLRALTMLTDERSPWLPDVPTLEEEFGWNATLGSSRGYAVPAGTPDEIIKVLMDAFDKVLSDPDFLKNMENIGLPLQALKGEEFVEYTKYQEEKFLEVYNAE